MRARYVATRDEIAKGNTEWEIVGPPEVRDVDLDARYFTPFRVTPHAEAIRTSSRRRSILISNARRRLIPSSPSWRWCSFAATSRTARDGDATHRCTVRRDCSEASWSPL